MRHRLVIVVVDESATELTILARCALCDVTVSERKVDVSEFVNSDVLSDEFANGAANEDSAAWLAHARRSFNEGN